MKGGSHYWTERKCVALRVVPLSKGEELWEFDHV